MTMLDLPSLPFTRWQQSLVSRNRRREEESSTARITERQEELAQAMSGGAQALASYLRMCLNLVGYDLTGALALPRQLTAEEAFEPPLDLEAELYEAWKGQVVSGQASQPAYWTVCHIPWLEDGLLGNDPIATFSTKTPGKRNSNLDNLTRDALRHLGGLPHIRGNVTAFSDCPLARAYWRRRVAVDAAAQAQGRLTVESAHNALHRSGQIWETFVLAAIKRLTVLNHPKTRAALVAHIAATPKITREEIAESGRRLARRGLSYSLDMLSWDELVEIAAGDRPAPPPSQRSGLGRILRR